MNQFVKEQLLIRFPNASEKEIKQAIKYQTKFSLTLDNLKCLNPKCNNIRKWKNTASGYSYICGNHICKDKTKKQVIEKMLQKLKITNVSKTGYESPLHNPEVHLKAKENYFKLTGYTNPGQNPEVKQKMKETYLAKTGYTNPGQNPEVKEKKQQFYLKKHNCTNFSNKHITNFEHWNNKQYWIDNFLTKDNNFDYLNCMKHFNCKVTRTHQKAIELGIIYNKLGGTSLKEQALIPVLEALQIINIITNSRAIIPPFELDIYLPDHNLAIEYNGAYWHQDSKKPADYHQSKSIACLSKGIRLLHIFEGYNDYNLEETLNEFLNYIPVEETGVFDLTSGCYPLVSNYKIQEPELINIMGFNIYDAGKIHTN